MMDIGLLILLMIMIIILTFFGVIYIYDRGWRSGYAEGKQDEPYKLITQGWQIRIPGCKGIIKLVDDSEGEVE